jgi:hypothetical protein
MRFENSQEGAATFVSRSLFRVKMQPRADGCIAFYGTSLDK